MAAAQSEADAAEAPAPWSLTGRGYLALLRPPPADDPASALPPDAPAGARPGGPALLMYVDYETSGVGPYRELLYIPGRFGDDGERRWSITRIVVSTTASVVAGRQNWGIPKSLADFDVRRAADGAERVRVRQDGRTLAELRFSAPGLRLPADGALLPDAWRRLVQYRDGRRYRFTPRARGPLYWTRLLELRTDGKHFPELGTERVLAAAAADDFRLEFPVAEVSAT